jgi:Rad3-related DNA helicase
MLLAVQETAGSIPAMMSYFPVGKMPRPEQQQAIEEIDAKFQSGSKIVAFQGPTGSGKSYVGMTFARQATASAQNVHLLTAQRVLQSQYLNDFRPPEIEAIMGRSNYQCTFDDIPRDASKGYCRRVEHAALIPECLKFGTVEQAMRFELPPDAHICPYFEQLTKSINAPVTLYNFQSFLFQQRLGRFGIRDLMILDECHNAENVLLQFVQVVISDTALKSVGVRLDLTLRTPEAVLAWLDREQVEKKIKDALGGAAETEDVATGFTPEETDRLRGLLVKIKDMRRFFDMTEWVVDVTEDGVEGQSDRTRKLRVRPVFVSPFAKELVFSKAKRVLAMSATILSPGIWAKNLGLSQNAVAYVDAPCPFPIKNRPIILEYAGDMGWKNQPETLPKLYAAIERILGRHRGERGIIHAHSERLCKLIIEKIRSPRFIHLDQFKMRDKTALLKAHETRPDSVIVGSGFHEGIDLKDDLARFAIIAKVPWPMMEDSFVKARIAKDKWFMAYQTSLKFLQSAGRVIRHKDDWAFTYILDSGFEHFMKQAAWLLPTWFKDAIQKPRLS